MHGNLVFDYGFSLKKRILENIDQFKDLYKEKLKFLSELTDGTQRVENQKLINERMIDLINDYKDEILDKPNRQNFISRNVYPSQSHYENGIVQEHRQNSDEQSRNVHTRKSYKEERMHEQRQNFSDGQARNVHSRRSHCKDEMVQNFSDRQSRNVHENRSHYEEEIIHDHRQNFSDGQSKNVHQKKSHYEDARRR